MSVCSSERFNLEIKQFNVEINMKKLLALTLTGMLAMAGTTFAAEAVAKKKGGPDGMPGIDQRMEMLTKQLSLTPEQQAKIKPLLEEERKAIMEARGKNRDMTPEERQEAMKTRRAEFNKKLKPILNAEQNEKLEKARKGRGPEGAPGYEKKGGKKGKGEGKK